MPPLTLDGTNGVSAVQAGAVESGDLPAGSVIQVVEFAETGTSSFSTATTQNMFEVSITPKLNSSFLHVFVSINGTAGRSSGSFRHSNFSLRVDTDQNSVSGTVLSGGHNGFQRDNSGSGKTAFVNCSMQAIYSNSSTDIKYIAACYEQADSSYTFILNNKNASLVNHTSNITVMEIAG